MQAALRDRNRQAPVGELHALAVLAAQVLEFLIGLPKSERLELARDRRGCALWPGR